MHQDAWVIRDSNKTIKMTTSRHIGNTSIIIAKCMTLKDNMLVVKNKGFLNLKIKGDSKIIIDFYNKKSNIHNSIMLLIKDTWKFYRDLNIYNCHYIY